MRSTGYRVYNDWNECCTEKNRLGLDFFSLRKRNQAGVHKLYETLIYEKLWQENGDCATHPLGIKHGYISFIFRNENKIRKDVKKKAFYLLRLYWSTSGNGL